MGVSYSVYLGPYIEAPNPVKLHPREFHSCPNRKCYDHKTEMSDKFCPRCGTEVALITVQSKKRTSSKFDVYKEFNDRLYSVHEEFLPHDKQDFVIFKPNQGKFGNRFEAYDSSIIAFNESMILDEVSRFKSHFSKDIDRIKEVFGDAVVRWGVVAYAS